MKRLIAIPILLALSVVAACATGPEYSVAKPGLPAVAPERGRVYFYRDNQLFGMGVVPAIAIRGRAIGLCAPGSIWYLELPAGTYRVSVATEVERHVDFEVAPGGELYVRCYLGPGFFEARAYLELVAADRARAVIGALKFQGQSTAF